MNLEKQVVSLELSKRLKELGVKQRSLFEWVLVPGREFVDYNGGDEDVEPGSVSAFTLAELGEMIPHEIRNKATGNLDPSCFGKNSYGEFIAEFHSVFNTPLVRFIEKTEADARAKLLIFALENTPTKEEKGK